MRGLGPFFAGVWRLSWPFFNSEERWAARGLLALMIVLRLGLVYASVLLNFWNGAFFNALQTKDWDAFINLLLLGHRGDDGLELGFTLIASVYVAATILYTYVLQWLQIRWRRWLTQNFIRRWTSDRAYYRMGLMTDPAAGSDQSWTDNPDQRISEDLRDFVTNTTELTVSAVANVVTLASFVGILWRLSGDGEVLGVTIPGYLVWASLLYAIVGTLVTHWVGRPLVGLTFRQQRVEADFRYALVRVRENAEGVALHRGEAEERDNLGRRFSWIVENWRRLMNRNLKFNTVTTYFSQFGLGVFPFIVGAPRYFAGKSTLGTLTQTVGAFSQVQEAMSWVVSFYDRLATWRAVVARLDTFQAAMDAATAPIPGGFDRAAAEPGLSGATVTLPDGAPLLSAADLVLRAGQSVVITGLTGSGKSTLFRTLAGLWPYGSGGVRAPDDSMFLPQRAYVPLGTLRHAVAYPAAAGAYTDAEVADALSAAGLPGLVPHLDEDANWPQRLSGGEQQRLALARVLLARPAWLFLDEATASLDPESEGRLYQTLRDRLPGTTIVSIAHRPSIAAVHDRRVVLDRGENGRGRLIEEEIAESAKAS